MSCHTSPSFRGLDTSILHPSVPVGTGVSCDLSWLCQPPANPLSFFCDQTNRTCRIVRTRRKYMAIAVGQAAPDFSLKDQYDKDVKLSDFAGKKNVVLVFYPLDWSPVCTNEHACLVNDMKRFETLDAAVLGVSVDSAWSHKAYAEKMGIKYSLLADFNPRGAMADKYGVYLAEKGIAGRAIVIVGKDGKVAWVKNYDIPVVPDVAEVASALQQVKAATA